MKTRSAEETRSLAEEVGRSLLRAGDLVVLSGELGAGKTAFAQGLARGLGVTEPVTSPTYTIVRHYEGRVPVTHVDIYRLERIQELHDLGFDEFIDAAVTFVEWGEAAGPLLPADRLEVRITTGEAGPDSSERDIEMTAHGEAWHARARRLAEIAGSN